MAIDLCAFDQAYCADHAGFSPGDFVMLAVSDNGCGMDRETRNNVFEPFFTTKGLGKGTGLGLAMVYGIVKQNNGFINVYREPGHGTTFKIYLAGLTGDIAEERSNNVKRASGGKGETVLIVEDEISILTLIEKNLTTLNYKVLIAKSPSEALETVKTHGGKIDLLITDVIMPEMNGRELAEKILVLYLSGYTADIIAHRGVSDKDFRFIQKPFSYRDLAAKARMAIDEKKPKCNLTN